MLARDIVVDEDLLAAIERGERTGDMSLYERLARALGVDVDDIQPESESA